MRRAAATGRRERRPPAGGWPRRRVAAASVAATLALSAGVALAAPGDLDPAFSADGRTTVNFGGDDTLSVEADIAPTPDGGSVVVGSTDHVNSPGDATKSFAIAKLQSDGSLDPAFGDAGEKVIDRGVEAKAFAVAVQPDGKIVVGGKDLPEGGHEFFDVLRLDADGSPDTSFGPGGFRSVDFGTKFQEADDIAIQPDGKIVAAGKSLPNGGLASYALARLNTDGSLDTSFGTGGKVTFGDGRLALGVALQGDGKIVVVGRALTGMRVARFNADGSVDTSFGQAGEAAPAFPGASAGREIAIQPDGKIVLVGSAHPTASSTSNDFGVARLDPTGALDPTFSNDGITIVDLGSTDDQASGVALQTNGKIVVGGNGDANDELAALRLNADGSADTSFGGDGIVGVGFASPTQSGGDVAIQPDGQILLSGVTDNNDDFAVARIEGDPTSTPPPPPPPPDNDPPDVNLTAKGKQDAGGKVKVSAKTNETCDLDLAGRVKPEGEPRAGLKPKRLTLTAGHRKTLKLKLSKKAHRELNRADRGRATINATCTDAAGNEGDDRAKVKLR